jgi:RNA recognition motif-containing protein
MGFDLDDLLKPPPPTATLYISGFGKDTTEESLLKYFGTIGVIRKHKETGKPDIFLYKDEAGAPRPPSLSKRRGEVLSLIPRYVSSKLKATIMCLAGDVHHSKVLNKPGSCWHQHNLTPVPSICNTSRTDVHCRCAKRRR